MCSSDLGMNAAGAAAGTTKKAPVAAPPAAPEPVVPEVLFSLARLRDYKTRRSSSWDRTGGNNDAVPVEAGHTATLLDITGAGVVTHLWFTINSPDPMHLDRKSTRLNS